MGGSPAICTRSSKDILSSVPAWDRSNAPCSWSVQKFITPSLLRFHRVKIPTKWALNVTVQNTHVWLQACFPDFHLYELLNVMFYRYGAQRNSMKLVKNRLHTMCWAIKRSQYIRSTPTRVTSLFIVGPSSETSPAEAATRMARHIQYVGLGDLVWFGFGWIWRIGLHCIVLEWTGLDWIRLEKHNMPPWIQMPQINTHCILLVFFLPVLKRDPVSRYPHQKCESMYFSCLNTWHHCRTRTGWVSTRWATLSLIYSTDGWMMGDEDATWDTFLKFATTMEKNNIPSP